MISTLYLCLSVDGFIATSNRIAKEESEWSDSAWSGWCGFCTESDNLIVGRSTYEELSTLDVPDILHPKHKIVVSSQNISPHPDWTHFTTPSQALEFLKNQGVLRAIVGGGRQTALSFVKVGLINEVILDGQPVLFGYGTNLLGELENSIPLDLVSTSEIGNSATRVHYSVVRK